MDYFRDVHIIYTTNYVFVPSTVDSTDGEMQRVVSLRTTFNFN